MALSSPGFYHRRPALQFLNFMQIDSPSVLLVDFYKMLGTFPSALELEAGELPAHGP